MGAGAHLDEWLAYGPGLLIRRRLAMRVAFTNRPEGKGYTRAYAQLMQHDGLDWRDGTVKTSLTAVLWLHDDPERMSMLQEMRSAMSPGERARLNSPISARQRVEKVLKARAGAGEETVRTSTLSILKRQLAEKDRENEHLRERLASAEDGSLFDLSRDHADDIVQVIVSKATPHKAKAIASGINKALRERMAPAG